MEKLILYFGMFMCIFILGIYCAEQFKYGNPIKPYRYVLTIFFTIFFTLRFIKVIKDEES